MGPASASERILYVDVLRGVALFGIIAANMRGFSAPESVYENVRFLFNGRADTIAQAFIDIFIQGKFITLFSFLFGLGFAIQMTRAQSRGARFLSFYPRRLAALAVFGLIHGLLIWWGDILLTYALTGAVLIAFCDASEETIRSWIVSLFAAPMLAVTGMYISALMGHGPSAPLIPLPNMTEVHHTIQIYSHGGIGAIYKENWVQWKTSLFALFFAVYGLALFLLGLYTWRSGIVSHLEDYKPQLKRVFAICIPAGIALNALTTIVPLTRPLPNPDDKMTFAVWLVNCLSFIAPPILSAGYAAGLALLMQHDSWKRGLMPFAAVGRMALTNYLMQSIVCTTFYYSYTTGLYGRVGPAMGLIPAVVIYAAQIPLSVWWLCHFRFGPMEWLWRGITYRKFPAMRRHAIGESLLAG